MYAISRQICLIPLCLDNNEQWDIRDGITVIYLLIYCVVHSNQIERQSMSTHVKPVTNSFDTYRNMGNYQTTYISLKVNRHWFTSCFGQDICQAFTCIIWFRLQLSSWGNKTCSLHFAGQITNQNYSNIHMERAKQNETDLRRKWTFVIYWFRVLMKTL